jgi:hypothetical protein
MKCNNCGAEGDALFDFYVPEPVWNYVMAGQVETTLAIREGLFDRALKPRAEGVGGVVCLPCFDGLARDRRIDYRDGLIVMGGGSWLP